MTTNRIVVGVDGSLQSRQALRWAADLAVTTGAAVRAVTVWEFPTTYGWATWPTDWDPPRDAHRLLTETVAESFEGRPPVEIEEVVREGNAAKVLTDEARFATMVVVGSRGHGGMAGVLLGSVSARVAEYAECPVLVVHGDKNLPGTTRKDTRKEALIAG
ncbi:universal stress protein [Kineosporia sp. J2-2]|uniref:Universal stress protein n=1 Tax=Kineosporia corallincola TaxID=2835133 RepID=A0ABS5TQU1_9ACTN|nr:universal stress protein [Kineosporia corallincola]MBT0772796.1 universal stress protein [Kineosporia corallincola]